MKVSNLGSMKGGWFVGDFTPVCYRTDAVEVAVKKYRAGDREDRHVHRVATELTVIVEGTVRMNGEVLGTGDVVCLEPGEATDFEALVDASTVVVKLPSVAGDKYLC